MSEAESEDGEDPVWDPGWDPLIGFLDRPSPASERPVQKGFGPVNRPKRKSDEIQLNLLFEVCRNGNIREAQSLIFHSPYLLPYTDEYGFTALHHAQLSKNGEFYGHLLEMLNNPRAFVKKMVWYENAEALRCDGLCLHREKDPDRNDGGLVTVRKVSAGSRAAWSDVNKGDRLEGVFTEAMQSKKLRKIMEELVAVANGGIARGADSSFPVAIEFRGPALKDILNDGGTAALRNLQKQQKKQLQRQRLKEIEASTPNAAAGAKVVLIRPARGEESKDWPKKTANAHTHSTLLPTLLVREEPEKQNSPLAQSNPLAPIHEARAAAGRAAERVAAKRRSKSCVSLRHRRSPSDVETTQMSPGKKLRPSISLPSLVPADPAVGALEKAQPSNAEPVSPTWSKPHWLPENSKGSKVTPYVPRKMPHSEKPADATGVEKAVHPERGAVLAEASIVEKADASKASGAEASKADGDVCSTLSMNIDAEQHSFIF